MKHSHAVTDDEINRFEMDRRTENDRFDQARHLKNDIAGVRNSALTQTATAWLRT